MPCARSLAPVLGAVVVYGTSCVRWYVACSARRSHRRARSRDTRSHVGACPGHRARPNRRYGCAVAWMAYSIVVPHCLSMVSCPGSAVRSNTTCKKRYMDVNFHVHPPQLGEGPMWLKMVFFSSRGSAPHPARAPALDPAVSFAFHPVTSKCCAYSETDTRQRFCSQTQSLVLLSTVNT